MRVAVTGAAGFVGRAVVGTVRASGHEAVAMVRHPDVASRIRELAGVAVVQVDLRDPASALRAVREIHPDVVIHGAWRGAVAAERGSLAQIENLASLRHLIEAALEAKVSRIVGIGSQAEYGATNALVTEETVPRPRTLYGICKLAAGQIGLCAAASTSLEFIWLRVFATYGPAQPTTYVIPHVITALLRGESPGLTTGEQELDYLYVADLARAIVAAAVHSSHGSAIFNLCSGHPVRLRDLISLVADALPHGPAPRFGAVPPPPGNPARLVGDPSRFIERFGAIALTPHVSGIEATVRWFADSLRKR
jgi:UDP-glucose 4-epimerase